jgi:hypothetical protein
MRCSVATLALVQPRSSWLRMLSLTSAAPATSFNVRRRRRRIARSRSPMSTRPFSADVSIATSVI